MAHPLIEALWDKAQESNMSVTRIAANCETSETYMYRMMSGDYRLSTTLLQAIASAYPDLHPLVIDYVIKGDGLGKDLRKKQGRTPPGHPLRVTRPRLVKPSVSEV